VLGVGAVPVVIAVRLVVLALVADQVMQREPVVARDEVDASVRPPAARLVQVARPGEPEGQLGYLAGIASPEASDAVAVLIVPLGPPHREVPYLVSTWADVPGFGDELHLGEDGILLDDVEERPQPVHVVQL